MSRFRRTAREPKAPIGHSAKNILLDKRYFVLPDEAFAEFTRMLERPPKENARLRRLLTRKAPWER